MGVNQTPDELSWSEWYPLKGASRSDAVSARPGLYRIRREGSGEIDYIGQTNSLRKRRAHLLGIWHGEMPYRDPHTAAPALWALRHATGCIFEASVAPVEGSTQWRKGMEALAISLYRQEHRRSPTVNFGRMPQGYAMSSGNNARLRDTGKRRRGGPTTQPLECHLVGVAPRGPLEGDPHGPRWSGHTWSSWESLEDAVNALPLHANGFYRLRVPGGRHLLYIGEGRIRARLRAHGDKVRGGHAGFAAVESFECSWVIDQALHSHQRLELENDLIAAHLVAFRQTPSAQFLG